MCPFAAAGKGSRFGEDVSRAHRWHPGGRAKRKEKWNSSQPPSRLRRPCLPRHCTRSSTATRAWRSDRHFERRENKRERTLRELTWQPGNRCSGFDAYTARGNATLICSAESRYTLYTPGFAVPRESTINYSQDARYSLFREEIARTENLLSDSVKNSTHAAYRILWMLCECRSCSRIDAQIYV